MPAIRRGHLALIFILLLIFIAVFAWQAGAQEDRLRFGVLESRALEANQQDRWVFEANRDDVLQFSLTATAGNLIPEIYLFNPEGDLLARLLANGEGSPSLMTLRMPNFGQYALEVRNSNQRRGEYDLLLSRLEIGLRSFEQGEIFYGQVLTQDISERIPYHLWTFQGRAGEVVDIYMTATGGNLQPVLSLTSPGGDVIASASTQSNLSQAAEARLLAFRLPSDGVYRISSRREGADLGLQGTSSGSYALRLSLRNGPNATAEILRPGQGEIGRLTADNPFKLYELSQSGNFILEVELNDPNCLVDVTLTNNGLAVLSRAVGRSPFQYAFSIPPLPRPLLELGTQNCPGLSRLEYHLRLDETNSNLPLQALANQTPAFGTGQSDLERWFFTARAGDLVQIRAQRTALQPNSFIRVVNPQGTVIYRQNFYTAFEATLLLPEAGAYIIQVASNGQAYQLQQNLMGENQLSFRDQAAVWEESLDVTSPQTWQFRLLSDAAATLIIEDPQGQILALARSSDLQAAFLSAVNLETVGRYRLKVFSTQPPRLLEKQRVADPWIAPGQTVKGSLSAPLYQNSWYVNLAANSGVSLALELLNPAGGILPEVSLLSPNGQKILAGATQLEATRLEINSLEIPLEGLYTVLVAGDSRQSFLDYRLSIQSDSAAPPPSLSLIAPSPAGFSQARPLNTTLYVVPNFAGAEALFESAPTLSLPDELRVELAPAQIRQAWALNLQRSQLLNVEAVSLSEDGRGGLLLLNADLQVVMESWQGEGSRTQLFYRAPRGGTYYVVLSAAPQGGRFLLNTRLISNWKENALSFSDGTPLPYGTSLAGDFSTRSEQDVYVFWGYRDSTVAFSFGRIFGDLVPEFILNSPSGRKLNQTGLDTTLPTTFTPSIRLPETGLYRLQMNATPLGRDQLYSRYALRMNILGGQELQPGVLEGESVGNLGVSVTENIWLIRGESNERLHLMVEPLSNDGPFPLSLSLTDSEGNIFYQQQTSLNNNRLEVRGLTLPQTGIYRLRLSGGTSSSGTYRLRLERDRLHLAAADYALGYQNSVEGVWTGENLVDRWVMSGNRGDVVALGLRLLRGQPALYGLQIQTPSGQLLRSGTSGVIGEGLREENLLLPETGLYYVSVGLLDPAFAGHSVYQLSLELQNQTHANALGNNLIGTQQSAEGLLFADDPQDYWLFDGQAGEVLTISLSGDGILVPVFNLYAYDAVLNGEGLLEPLLARSGTAETPAVLNQFVLPQTGAYAIRISGTENGVTGRYTLSLQTDERFIAPQNLLEDGKTYEQSFNRGEAQRWQINGQAGDVVSLVVNIPRRSSIIPALTLRTAEGAVLLRESRFDGETLRLENYTLPRSDVYIVDLELNFTGLNIRLGTYNLSFTQARPPAPALPSPIRYGGSQIDTLTPQKDIDEWAFMGQAGDVVRIRAERSSGELDPRLTLFDPSGALLASDDDSLGNLNAELVAVLPNTGEYRVQVSNSRFRLSGENNYRLDLILDYQAATLQAPPDQLISYGAAFVDTFDPFDPAVEPAKRWYFSGQAGDRVDVGLQFPRNDRPLRLFLTDGAGNRYLQAERRNDRALIQDFELPADGLYGLLIERPGDTQADEYYPYSLSLNLRGSQETARFEGFFLQKGQSYSVEMDGQTRSTAWLYTAQAGEEALLSLLRLQGENLPSITVLDPANQILAQAKPEAGAISYNLPLVFPMEGLYQILLTGEFELLPQRYRLGLTGGTRQNLAGNLFLNQSDFGQLNDAIYEQAWLLEMEAGRGVYLQVQTQAPGLELEAQLEGLDGVVYASSSRDVLSGRQVILLPALPESGQYRLIVRRRGGQFGQGAGVYQLRWSEAPSVAQSLTAPLLPPNTPTPAFVTGNEAAVFSFYAEPNVPIALAANVTAGEGLPSLRVSSEQGELISSGLGLLAEVFVPRAGFYLLSLNHPSPLTLEIIQAPRANQDPSGLPLVTLRRQTNTSGQLSTAAPARLWGIEAQAGESLQFQLSDFSLSLRTEILLFDPDGLPMVSASDEDDDNDITLAPVFMPKTGLYTLRVGPWLGQVGNAPIPYVLRIDQADPALGLGSEGGPIRQLGTAVYGGLDQRDSSDIWTFEGLAGSRLSLDVGNIQPEALLALSLTDPQGARLNLEAYLSESSPAGSLVEGLPLTLTGVYSLELALARPDPASTVLYRLQLQVQTPDLAQILSQAQNLPLNQGQGGVLTSPAQVQAWVFYAQAGQSFSISSNNAAGLTLTLLNPNGQALQTSYQGRLLPTLLLEDGFYSVLVQSLVNETNAYELLATPQSPEATWRWQLALGDNLRAALSPAAPLHQWTLSDYERGQYQISVRPTTRLWQAQVYLLDSQGERVPVEASHLNGGSQILAFLDREQHPYYTLYITTDSGQTGAYDVAFDVFQNRLSPARLEKDQPVAGRLNGLDNTDEWLWDNRGDNFLNLSLSRTEGTAQMILRVYAPGNLLLSQYQSDEAGQVRVENLQLPIGGVYIIQVTRGDDVTSAAEALYELILQASPAPFEP